MAALLRSIDDPTPHAVGEWNLGEVAMHLSQAWVVVPGLARRDLSRVYDVVPSIVGAAGDSLIQDMWDLAGTTILGVKSDPERNPAVLAERIETRAQEYLNECVGADPDAPCPWLVQGATVGQSTLTYHLLSETVMHGYDIAHAAGRKWHIEPAHAAMAVGRFIVPIIQALDPRALVNGAKAAGVRATYDIRIRGGDRFHFYLRRWIGPGRGTASPPGRLSHLGRPRGIPHGDPRSPESVDRDQHRQADGVGSQAVAGPPAQGHDA